MLLLLTLIACDDFLARGPLPQVQAEPKVVARLNRVEYDNTVRDLFGTSMRPSADFPSDDFGYGFDNIADVLSISPLHVELYQRAAHELVAELYGQRVLPAQRTVFEAETAQSTGGAVYDATAWVLFGQSEVFVRPSVDSAGTYTLAAMVSTHRGLPSQVALRIDDTEVMRATVSVEQRIEATIDLEPGRHTLAVAFLDDEGPLDSDEDLVVDWLELTGPFEQLAPRSAGYETVLSCVPASPSEEPACAEQIVRSFGRRAWRRPLSPTELTEQLGVYGSVRASGASFDEGIAATLEALLMSPSFMYRVELDPVPGSTQTHFVGPYELATRLSYFLWSSTPDDELLALAATGELLDPPVLDAQARRMLNDPRATALVDNLGGQWLGLRRIEEAAFDPTLYPSANAALLRSMHAESAELVRSVFLDDAPLSDLLTSTTSTVDDRLADHYGLGAAGTVDVPERPGLLTRGGFLASSSYPTRTSPVRRGAWVLEKILCSAPPPAPAGVPSLEDASGASVLEQLAQHRADPSCAGCHDAMDPIGIALESFDADGRIREEYADGQPVIDDAVMQDGTQIESAADLIASLARDPRVQSCAVQQTFTYAMGRPPGPTDADTLMALESLVRDTESFQQLVLGIIGSTPFRSRPGGSR